MPASLPGPRADGRREPQPRLRTWRLALLHAPTAAPLEEGTWEQLFAVLYCFVIKHMSVLSLYDQRKFSFQKKVEGNFLTFLKPRRPWKMTASVQILSVLTLVSALLRCLPRYQAKQRSNHREGVCEIR